MNPLDIKVELMRVGKGNLAALAREFEQRLGKQVRREEVSMCVNQLRQYPVLQELIAETISKPREQVFGNNRRAA
jgi:hypothetical protein